VETEQLILAAWQPHEDGFKLYFGIEPDKASQLATEAGVHLRAFLGYSGWTGGQLEGELEHKTWVITSVPGDLMQHPHDDALWRAVLGGMGDEWKLRADEPEDPAQN
jgi:putative transcriptional regulator